MIIEKRDSLKGEITIPGDRSISHRSIVFGSIAQGVTEIDNFYMGEFCLSTIDCFRKMDVAIEILSNNKVKVHGNGLYGLKPSNLIFNAGKSGTSIRLLLGVLSSQSFGSKITRDEHMLKKPVGKTVSALKQMGAVINGKNEGNYCPLFISPAKLNGISYEVSPPEAHIKSPLLIAGLYADGETTVIESVRSRNHSELMLNSFGANITVDGFKATSKKVENLYAQHIEVPGDISIAAYFITAALIVPDSEIVIKNVGINPTRTGILDVYKAMGAKIKIMNKRTINNEEVADIKASTSSLKATTIEGDMIIRLLDEIPVIAVAATQAKGKTVFKNLNGFKIKDSNKVQYLSTELSKLGAHAEETEDGLIVEGGRPLKGTVLETYNEYSIAMALSIAGLIAEDETMIRKAQVIDTVFSGFYDTLNSL